MKLGILPPADRRRRHFRKLKQEMDEAGVAPTFDVNKIGVTFLSKRGCEQESERLGLTASQTSESMACNLLVCLFLF